MFYINYHSITMTKNVISLKSKYIGIGLFGLALVLSGMTVSQAAGFDSPLVQMSVGSQGESVRRLQLFLASDRRIYPQGKITGYYGPLTRDAVVQFQANYGLPQVGNVGPLTLARIRAVIAAGYGLDVDAPIMTTAVAQANTTAATIGWTTNELARAKVYYDTVPIRSGETIEPFSQPAISGTLVSGDAQLRTSHSIGISGLLPNTTYYYVVESVDASGNVSMSVPTSFVTPQ